MLKLFVIAFCSLSLTLSVSSFAAPNENAYKNANKNASFKNGKNGSDSDSRLLGDLIDKDDDNDDSDSDSHLLGDLIDKDDDSDGSDNDSRLLGDLIDKDDD